MIGFWTADKVAALRRMVDEGASAAQIARQVGASRNAVIGKVTRLRLRLGGNPRARADRPAIPAGEVSGAEPVAPALPPVAFLAAVEAGTCLFFACEPYGPGGPDMPVCGGERVPGSRYCAFHGRASVDRDTTGRFRRELRGMAA